MFNLLLDISNIFPPTIVEDSANSFSDSFSQVIMNNMLEAISWKITEAYLPCTYKASKLCIGSSMMGI